MVGAPEGDLLVLILLLLFAAFFSGTEAAYLAISRSGVRQMRERRLFGSGLLALQHHHRPVIISALLLGITMSNYMAERLATGLAIATLGPAYGPVFGPLVAIVVMTVIIIAFCEVVPIQIGAGSPERVARFAAVLVTPFAVLLLPVVLLISFLSRGLLWLGGVRTGNLLPGISEDHLKAMIEKSEEQGVLEEGERRMMHGALDFADRTAAQLMTPRPDMVCVAADDTLVEALQLGLQRHYSRLPVYEDSSDNIIGVLHLKDLLPYLLKGEMDVEARVVARCAHHVPEGLPADELLRQLQKRHQMVAIVKDEYGGTAGIVSIEDVLEEIVGDIVDEYDVEEPEIVQESDTELLCEAGIGLHQLEPWVSDDLPTEEYDSLGGLVLDLAGRIPAAGDQFQWRDLTFTIVSVSGPRLERVRVSFPPPEPPWQAGVGDDDE